MDPKQKDTKQRFRQLLETFEPRRPKRKSIVNGVVLRIDEDAVLMDIGAHQDAIVPRKELGRLSDEDLAELNVGDKLPVYVMRSARWGGDLVVSIERGMEQQDWERADRDLTNEETLELEVVGENRGGVLVKYGRLQGFVPNSHLPERPQHDRRKFKRALIGSKLALKPIEVNPKRQRLVFSGREARKERELQRLKELNLDQVVEGRVVNLVDFGAFVDIGGFSGLLHISELSHRTDIGHPSEVLEIGQQIKVAVKDIDLERQRVDLSRKALLPTPWQRAIDEYAVGDLVEGRVTNVVDFGAFLRLPDGIEGMIHKSELGIESQDGPSAIVQQGDKLVARILNIEPEKEQMKLSIRDVSLDEEMEWRRGEDGENHDLLEAEVSA